MKRFLKLLCYSLITVFLLGFGGEKVLAVDAPGSFKAKEGTKWISFTKPYKWWSTVKTVNGGNFDGQYIYCLDSYEHIFTIGLYEKTDNLLRSYIDDENYKANIARILTKAYRLGLGNGQSHKFTIEGNEYNVTEVELYGITQSAVWFAAHGYGDEGYTAIYQNWMKGKEKIFQYLIEVDDFSYDLQITSDGNAMTVDGEFLVSGEYTVVSNVPTTLTASVNGGKMKVGDGQWTSDSVNVTNGQKIRLRADKPQSGEVKVTLTVESNEFVDHYDVYTYAPSGYNTANSRYQNLVLPIENKGSRSASVTAIGNYDEKGTVKVRKVDADTNNPVADASLVLVRKDSKTSTNEDIISYFISKNDELISEDSTQTDGGYYTYSNLKPGYYCIKEIKAPDGYVYNENSGYYIDTNGDAQSENGACGYLNDQGTLEITKTNKQQRVKYRKVDGAGNPIAGVRVEIHNGVEESTNKKPNYPYLCGISGADGYLTEKCPGWNDSNSRIISPDSNGSFPIGWDNDKDPYSYGGIYYVNEEFKEGYYNPDLAFGNDDYDFGFRDIYNPKTGETAFGFGYANAVVANKGYITFNGNVGIDSYVTVNIINDRYINISKIDTGTGKEISGAEMVLYDLSIKDYSIVEDLDLSDDQIPFVMVDSWTSDGQPHTFIGIVPHHKYRLEETLAPAGYVRLETVVEFTVDEDGKVVLSEETPTQVLLAGGNDVSQQLTMSNSDLGRYIIVGNDLQINPPNTGISLLNKIAIGGLLVFVGYEFIKIYRRKANS